MTTKKYQIILADPPWQYGSKELYGDKINGYKNGQRKRFAKLERKYPTMKIEDIKKLPIKNITENNSVCFIWSTDSHIKQAIEVSSNSCKNSILAHETPIIYSL